MTEIEIRGARLFYTERGSGEPVVFVHGGLSDYRTWAPQVEAIGERYRAITYSRRWHWPNAPVPTGGTSHMDTHVEDLAEFITRIGAAPANVVGNSWGAYTSLVLARRYPALVRSLVVEEPPVIPLFFKKGAPTPGELLRAFARRPRTAAALMRVGITTIGPVTKLFKEGEDERAMIRFVHGVVGREAYESLPEERRQQMRANLSELAAEFRINGGFASFTDNDARAIRVPTLALTGAKSPAMFVRLSERLLELLPDARHIVIPAASHVMHEQNAPATNAAILAFLSERRARAAA
ncbi:MAG: alpha/beta fold hydrolase [Candidatus Limnocylindria bacterium]